MAGSYSSQLNPGAFVPTTNIWDVSESSNLDVSSPAFKELMVRLYQNVNAISVALNIKDTGYYTIQEFLNGQLFFPNPGLDTTSVNPLYRQVFRTVVNFGALPNTDTKSIPHGIAITQSYSFTRIYGTSSNQIAMEYLPLPYSSNIAGTDIELNVDAVNVNVTTAIDLTAFTTIYIVLEYIKQ